MAGSNPTFAECFTQLGLGIKVANEVEKFGSSNSPNTYDMEDALKVAIDGEYTPALVDFVAGVRAALSSSIDRQRLQRAWLGFFADVARSVNLPSPLAIGVPQFLWELRRYMDTNTKSIKTRTMSYGAASAGSNTGNGTISLLTVDEYGNTIEAAGADVLTWRCEGDQLQGRGQGAELFRVRTEPRARDNLDWEGSGLDRLVEAVHAGSFNFVTNPSFDTNGASADNEAPSSTTAMRGWTFTGTTNVVHRSNSAYVHATYPGAPSTPWGLEFSGTRALSQIIRDVQPGAKLPLRTPLYWQIAWKRLASATGTLTVALGGNASATVDVSTGVNGTWNILRPTINENLWYPNFAEDALDVVITADSIAIGTIAVDDLRVAPWLNIDGLWYVLAGGSTPFKVGDSFTNTHTEGARGILAYWLWQAFGADGWLPTSGTPSEADPT